jgi:predicted DNA binding CopG/RHH family protein
MKEAKLSDLVYDEEGTKRIRELAKNTKKVKITINFDSDILEEVKELAEEIGAPYQTLLNKIVRNAMMKKQSLSKRVDKLEKELKALKKKLG